ncbi:MAG: ABC transporter substrate-binding protein [Lachnospiraceae bacterium]|nr:ABC transporter substrate-binding protein [Lachnospiraceae bacterium]
MKKFNKFVSVAVASAMVMALAGCGAADKGAADKGSSDTFKIGGIGPTTGGAAIYGLAVQNAAQLAVDDINAAGGVNGYKLEMNFQDDEHDPEKALNAYNVVKDWGAQVLVGCVTSGPCIAVTEKTKADNMFQLTPSGTAVECTQYDNCFRVCFSDPNQGLESAKYIGENGLATKVAVIYDSSDVYSSGIYEAFAKEAANQSFEIVAAEAFTADSKTDFSVQLQKAKDAGADMVFLPIYYQESALILTQAAGMDYAPVFFSCDGMDGILGGVENFDTALAEGVMLLSPFASNSTDELTQKFVASYQEKYGEVPNQFAADAYDAVYAIKAAIEKSGVTPDMSVSDICDKIKEAMTQISIEGVTAKGLSWTADGEPNKEPMVLKIENGAYTIL